MGNKETLKTPVKINSLGFVKEFTTTTKEYTKGEHEEISNFFTLCGSTGKVNKA